MNIFLENLQNPSLYIKEQGPKKRSELKLLNIFKEFPKILLHNPVRRTFTKGRPPVIAGNGPPKGHLTC